MLSIKSENKKKIKYFLRIFKIRNVYFFKFRLSILHNFMILTKIEIAIVKSGYFQIF